MRWAALVLILVCAGLAQVVAGRLTESLLNPVVEGPLGTLSDEALALHRGSEVADLHADSLLFGRDLLERASRGHLDLPRMLEGGMALQVFSVVSKAPFGYDLERTDGDRPDYVTLLALQQLWPIATYTSLHERVILHDLQGRTKTSSFLPVSSLGRAIA
jgi:hypothetical protein